MPAKHWYKQLPDGWSELLVREVARINPALPKKHEIDGARRALVDSDNVTFCKMEDFSEDGYIVNKAERKYGETKSGYTAFIDDDILVAKITPCFQNGKGAHAFGLTNGVGFGSTEFHVVRPADRNTGRWLRYIFRMDDFLGRGRRNMQGSAGQQRVPADFIKAYHLPVPPPEERVAIANVIDAWDDAVKHTGEMLKAKQCLKRGLMQKLLFGRERFCGFDYPWTNVRIGDLLRDTSRMVKLDDNTEYRLVSIRRRSGGLFDREVRQGRDIGYNRLKTIKTGDFVIARRQILHGAMTEAPKEFDGAFVSDAYCTLVPRKGAEFHMPFFNYLSQTPLMYYKAFRCSYGVALEKMFFNLNWFLDEEILLPPTVEEQKRIADTLKCVDDEIEQLRLQLEAFKAQKKGLMQKLLTGQIRVTSKGA